MERFNFTQKKFASLSNESQRKHIIKWLLDIYQSVSSNRLTPGQLNSFRDQYRIIASWIGDNPFAFPEADGTRPWLEFISDQIHFHRTCLGLTPKDPDLLEKIQTRDNIHSERHPKFDCHVALEGLRSLFNIGTIIRTCEAAGFQSVILGKIPDTTHPGIQKTAMGADQWIDIIPADDLFDTLMEKKKTGYQILGIETVKGAPGYDTVQWQEKSILVFGNEEYGISSHLMQICDSFVQIPMYGRKNSINVANAVSVVAFHVAQALSSKG